METVRHPKIAQLTPTNSSEEPFLWLINPDALTLETYQLHEGRWVEIGAYSKPDRPRAVPFDAIELELTNLWADVEPPPEEP